MYRRDRDKPHTGRRLKLRDAQPFKQRVLAKSYEFLPKGEEAFAYEEMVRLMLRRLAKAQ